MAKNETKAPDVVWTLTGDAMRPAEAPWGFIVRNPLQIVLMPNTSRTIDTGVACSVPVLAYPRRDNADRMSVPMLIPAGTNIVVLVNNNNGAGPLVVEDRESLVNLTPLVFNGTSVVG